MPCCRAGSVSSRQPLTGSDRPFLLASGLASGVSNVSMQVSAAVGLAAIGTISADHTRVLAAQGQSLAGALTGGYQLGFVIAGTCVALGLLVVLVVLRAPRAQASAILTPDQQPPQLSTDQYLAALRGHPRPYYLAPQGDPTTTYLTVLIPIRLSKGASPIGLAQLSTPTDGIEQNLRQDRWLVLVGSVPSRNSWRFELPSRSESPLGDWSRLPK